MKIEFNKKILTAIFVLSELTLCILVQLIGGEWLSFSAIALALLYVLLLWRWRPVYLFGVVALLFTTLADICLVLLMPRMQLLGMVFFTITQLCYFALILFRERSVELRRANNIIRLIALSLVSVIAAVVLSDRADALSIISALYYTNLLVNVVFAFISTRGGGSRARFLLPIGLLFFAVCDLFVGFAELAPYFTIREGTLAHFLANPPFNIAWLFYIPSQTMLAVSITINKES